MTTQTLTDPPVPQWRSSQAAIAVAAPLLAGVASILLTAFAFWLLPDEIAGQTMMPINLSLAAAGGGGSVLGVGGLRERGLMLTRKRIENQEVATGIDEADDIQAQAVIQQEAQNG